MSTFYQASPLVNDAPRPKRHLYAVPTRPEQRIADEESPAYDTQAELVTIETRGQFVARMRRECGPTAVMVWAIAESNAEVGEPNTYALLETACELSTRQLQRIVNTLETHGFIDVTRGRGRAQETRITPRKYDIKGDTHVALNGKSTTERVTVSTTERVTSPPIRINDSTRENDSGEEIEEPVGQEGGAGGRKVRKKPARPMPKDFVVGEAMKNWAARENFSDREVAKETPKFIDYWISKGEIRPDWEAAWRNWMRKSREFGGAKQASTPRFGDAL